VQLQKLLDYWRHDAVVKVDTSLDDDPSRQTTKCYKIEHVDDVVKRSGRRLTLYQQRRRSRLSIARVNVRSIVNQQHNNVSAWTRTVDGVMQRSVALEIATVHRRTASEEKVDDVHVRKKILLK
jgi:hypothetical protein